MVKAATLPRNETGIETALGILKQRFGDRLQTGKSIREQHGHTTTWIENQPPDAVVFHRILPKFPRSSKPVLPTKFRLFRLVSAPH